MRSATSCPPCTPKHFRPSRPLFKDDWEGLLGNADTLVYLGGNEPSTHKYISELLGKETLDTRNRSVSRGSHGSSSVSYQQTGRELMTPDRGADPGQRLRPAVHPGGTPCDGQEV